ncbi:MAG: type II toxin-antitoxin system Phd/YefM family antitoxin [Acidobacteriota bacterium]|nr:type II toxin-antitoxin system Phd/YefM family antitoxin [Acidobacteriota bacterium]MDH3522348.1 type II toxin-antitoxin system Phd/YefM family antitoxin [Acidobacteriota bacterium]
MSTPSQVNVHDAKTHLSRLLDRAAAGEEIVIARYGRPVARLVPLAPAAEPRRLGLYAGQIRLRKDFERLPAELLAAFEGGDV